MKSMVRWAGTATVAIVLVAGVRAERAQPVMSAEAARIAVSRAAFIDVARVLTHPRCMNCHTATDFPRQGDDRHPHIMNVRRGLDNHGGPAMSCSACHGSANNRATGVPGAKEDWHLAPLSMAWEGLSPQRLCETLKDPAKNGGRTGLKIIDHLQTELVLWAWKPGVDLNGLARTQPPLSHAAFVAAAERWVKSGAACPPSS